MKENQRMILVGRHYAFDATWNESTDSFAETVRQLVKERERRTHINFGPDEVIEVIVRKVARITPEIKVS